MMSADVGIVLGSLLDLASKQGGVETPQGDLVFGSHVTAEHGLVLDGGGALVFEDGLVVTGDLVLTHASSVTFKGNVEVTGNVIIDAAGTILFGSLFSAGGAVALASDEVDFLGGAGSAGIAGDLSIQAHTAGLPIQVGFTADAFGSLGLTDADLAALNAGGKLTIGSAGSSGTVLIDSAEFRSDVSIFGADISVQQGLFAGGARVSLVAEGIVRNDGLIDVSASVGGGQAGAVHLAGKYAGNFGTILAQGAATTAGGSVKIESTIQTLVSSAGVIDASGGAAGGTIILWSDNNTTMAGSLSARGGKAGGDGGFVEVSSAGGFSMTGQVDTTAVSGKTGMFLLDPKNVIIAAAGPGTLLGVSTFAATPSADVTIAASTITGAASAVTIQANNDITVNAALSAMGQDLTLQAGRSVLINQSISLTNKTLTIIANDDAGTDANRDAGAGSITAVSGVTLGTGSGTINLTVEPADPLFAAGVPGGITIDKVVTTGTLNISTAGFVKETAGDAVPVLNSMTTDDDLTAGTLNLIVTGVDATFGEALDAGNGALEVAAGTINANVVLPGMLPATDFVGSFVITDADHTNGGPSPWPSIGAPMTIGTFNAGSGTVILTAKGAPILGTAGPAPNITAIQVNLTSELYLGPDFFLDFKFPHYGSIGTLAAPIRTDIGALTATASHGGVFIDEANGLLINKVIAQDNGVTPQAGENGKVVVWPQGGSPSDGTSDAKIIARGDIVISEVKVADQFTLMTVTAGMIVDGNQEAQNILARGLTLNTVGAIGQETDPIETTVMTLQATTGAGGVFISEGDGADVSITAGGSGSDVILNNSMRTLVLGTITTTGGDVTVKANFDAITDGNGAAANIVGATANLESPAGLGTSGDKLEVNVGTLSTKVTNSGAGTYVMNAAALTALAIETKNGALDISFTGGSVAFVQPGTLDRLSLASAGMDFSFSNTGGKVVLNGVNAGTGVVSITAKTLIDDSASPALTGGAVTLKAGTSIGSAANKINTNLDTLTATANAGGIFIADSGAITSLTATAKGAGNDLEVTTVGDLMVAKVIAPDAVTLTAGGSGNIRRIGGVLNVSGISASLHAGGGIGTSAEPLLLDVATLTLAKADAGGTFLRFKNAVTATEVRATGDLEMSSDGDMTIGVIAAGAANTAKLTSPHGAIRDGNAAALNISGGTANLSAGQIGTSADPIDTDIGSLTAVGNSGGVFIKELNALTVVSVEALGLGSHISLTTGGDMLLSVVKAEGDEVSLTANPGRINDGNGATLNITADLLDISATAGIDTLQNRVNRLGSANGGTGGVTISNIGPLAITDATIEGQGPSMLTIQAESITVLDMADDLAALDLNGSLKLEAVNGNVIFLDPNDTLTASGTGTLAISAAPTITPAYPDTGAVAVIGNLTTAGGAITIEANHHITIGFLNTGGTGDVTVISQTGVIIDGNGAATNIKGKVVTLSGALPSARVAALETSIRIADYSATRSEAAAKLTTAQSLSTATAIMDIQQQNALEAKEEADSAKGEAEQTSDSAASAADTAATTKTTLDGISAGLTIAADVAEVVAAVAQAIPLSGDGGASVVATALSVGADVAAAAAFVAGVEADRLAGIAEEAANAVVLASAELTALNATFEDSLATWRAFDEATSVAQKAADAAAIARDHALVVRNQAIFAEDQANVIGTAADPLQIEAQRLDATATDGSVFLSVTGDLNLGGISATGTGGVVSVEASGNIYVKGTTVAPSRVVLDAGLSIIEDGGSIDAPEFLGLAQINVGTIAAPILTTIDTLAVHAVTGTVGISNSGALEIGSIDGVEGVTAAGAVGITSTGSLTFTQTISAAGQTVTLLSQDGAIIDDHTGSPEVTALTLNATAKLGIELDTDVANLTASVTGAGAVEIREANGITLTSVQTFNGPISVEAEGTIVATSVVSTTDADANDISLKATSGGGIQVGTVNAGAVSGDVTFDASTTGGAITMLGGGRVTADALVATAASGITLTTTAKSADLEVSGTGGITVNEFDALLVNNLTTADGAISLTTGGQVTLVEGAVDAAGGASNVTINAAGRIIGPVLATSAADILGAIVSLVTSGAGSTIGASIANPLEINARVRLDAQTAGSNAFIDDTDGGVVIGLANLGLGNLHLKALAGSITAAAPGNGVADIVAAHVDLKVTNAMSTTSTIGSGETSQLDIDGSTLTLLTAGGSAFLADTAGGVAINTLNTGIGNLFLTATGGAITDNDGGAANNIVATNLMLSATAGVGTGANPIEATVTALEGFGGTGGFALTDLSGGLVLGGVTGALSGVSVTGGSVIITALSPLTVDEAVTNTGGGDITLTATDSAGTGDDLKVNANITASGGMGGIKLLGGDDVVLALGTTVSAAGGTVEIRGDNGNADAEVGSQMLLNGAIRANRLEVTSYGDDDTLYLKDAIVTSQAISTGGGDDEIEIAAGNTLGTGTLDAGAGDDTVTIRVAIENFAGGDGDDRLLVKAGGSVTGSADGGADYDEFVYDHDGLGGDDYVGPVTVNLQTRTGTGVASFQGFDRFEATTNGNDRLIGANAAKTWQITGANAGNIGGAGVFDFTGFEYLKGGTQDDAFQFGPGGSLAGDLDGAGHAVRNTIDYHGANFGAVASVILDGTNGGTATAIAGRFDNIDEVIGDIDFTNTNALVGNDASNVWTFTGIHDGNISNGFFFQHFGDTTGGNMDDTFGFADNTLPSQPVKGGGGIDILDLSAWTSNIRWNITGDSSGNVVTVGGTFDFSGMDVLRGGSANDRFIFSDDKIVGQGLASPGAIVGNAGTDFIDMSSYTTANLWNRTNLNGTIQTARGTWTYSSIEEFLGSKTTTFQFDVVDLIGRFTNVGLPAQLLPTQGGAVSVTLSNIGNDEVLDKYADVSFYLSLDGKLDASDVLIGITEHRFLFLLAGDTTGVYSAATQVPFGTAPGAYHVLGFADSGAAVSEGDESNNVFDGGMIQVLPVNVDLVPVFTKSTLPDQGIPGTKGTLTTVVTNVGNSPAKGKIDVEFFLSRDGTLDPGDIALGGFIDTTINIAGGASRTFTYTTKVPVGTAPDDYQVLVRIDGKDNVLERNETNNVAVAADPVHINLPFADLVAEFTRATLPTIGVPGDTLHFQVPVKNLGNIPAVGKIDVDFYLSVDGTVSPGSDVLLKSLDNVSISIGPNGERTISSSALIPSSITGGTFFVLADIDSTNVIAESNNANNTAVSTDGLEVVWRFGSFANRRNVHLIVPDANGNMVNFGINGEGVGDVLGGSNFTEISLVGTTTDTTVSIVPRGAAKTQVGSITSTNTILQLNAPKVKLLGDLSINGGAVTILLGDVTSNQKITIGSEPTFPNRMVDLKLGHVANLNLTSGTAIRSLSVIDWLDTDMTQDLVQAPFIGAIRAAGNFQADIVATSSNAGVSLASFTVKGGATSQVTLAGGAGTINVGGWSGGSLDAVFATSVAVRGDLANTRLTLSGAGLAADKLALGTLSVTGRVSDSLINVRLNAGTVQVGTWGAGSVLAVGVDSGADGTFFDGNETAIGGILGQFKSTTFDTANGGTAFGFVVDGLQKAIQLNPTTKYTAAGLPIVNGDLKLKVL